MTFIRRTPSRLRLHDLTHSPVGLWQLNGNTNDSSGNGVDLTTSDYGGIRYRPAYPGGPQVGFFDGDTIVRNNSTSISHLQITGDITVELLVLLRLPLGYGTTGSGEGSISRTFVAVGDTGATEPVNVIWSVRTNASGQPGGLRWFHQHGAGNSANYENPDAVLGIGEWYHVAMRRQSDQISMFIDGEQVGATSSALTTATGGTSTFLILSGVNPSPSSKSTIWAMMSSVKVIDSALTDGQIQEEFERTLG